MQLVDECSLKRSALFSCSWGKVLIISSKKFDQLDTDVSYQFDTDVSYQFDTDASYQFDTDVSRNMGAKLCARPVNVLWFGAYHYD